MRLPSLPGLASRGSLLLVLLAFGARSPQAQSLQTFVLTAGGQSSCTTGAAPPVVVALFGPQGVFEPSPSFAACNVPATVRSLGAASGPLSDTQALVTAWGPGPHALDATTQVQARYGILRAQARSVYAGESTTLTVAGAEGFSTFTDTFTITSPDLAAGTPATLRLLVDVGGHLSSTVGNGTADVELVYRVGLGPIFTLFRSQSNSPLVPPFLTSVTGNGLSGFTLGPGTMSGSGQLDTLAIPIVLGTPFQLQLALLAFAVPGATSTTESDFQARVAGFAVSGPGGQAVANLTVSALSGASYGPPPRRKWALVGPPVPTAPLPLLPGGLLPGGLLPWGPSRPGSLRLGG